MNVLSHHPPRAIDPSLPVELVVARVPGGGVASICVAVEQPIAFKYNGFSHAVMMASPIDLEDFAFGFSLTEGVIECAGEIGAFAVVEQADGTTIEISLTGSALHRYLARRRVRRLSGNTSCGLCGVEDLADAVPRASRVPPATLPNPDFIRRVAERLRECQPLARLTRGAHAAAWISAEGFVETVREDVGRHNALDKLIGAKLRDGTDRCGGFCLITSRCSFEMVEKAAAAGFSTLVSISAPTVMAIRKAQAAGLTLFALSGEFPLLYASGDTP